MEARGFGGGQRTWARESTYSLLDVWVLVGGVVIAAAAVLTAVGAGTWSFVWR
jgi:energy-coupling factor transport system permease protein